MEAGDLNSGLDRFWSFISGSRTASSTVDLMSCHSSLEIVQTKRVLRSLQSKHPNEQTQEDPAHKSRSELRSLRLHIFPALMPKFPTISQNTHYVL